MKEKFNKNSDFMKNIKLFNDYADYLVDLDRDKYISFIIMARAMRTIIDPNAKFPNLESDEDKFYWVHQCIIEFVVKHKEVNHKWFIDRICMLPEPTNRDILDLQETINNIRKANIG